MKRILGLVAIMFAFVSTTFASNDYELLTTLNNKTTLNAISHYIQADFNQKDQLAEIFRDSAAKLDKALKANDEVAAKKALYFNLANTRSVLNAEQYRKYLTVLNLTYNNRYDDLLADK